MNKVLISVEGQTEETFVREVLQPRFEFHLFLQPVVLKTRRVPGRSANRGGHVSYCRIKKELLGLLGDTSARAVTTMYDFYALPHDFPGYATMPRGSGARKVDHLEQSLANDIEDFRFNPYLQIHEFEAMLFSEPESIVNWMNGTDRQLLELSRVRQAFLNPEEINDDPNTSPSHRILEVFPAYEKVIAGSLIVKNIGLNRIRASCPHFDEWMSWLENLL
jgi:hypothetical protein